MRCSRAWPRGLTRLALRTHVPGPLQRRTRFCSSAASSSAAHVHAGAALLGEGFELTPDRAAYAVLLARG
jgi:hypothetical protein